LKRKKAAEEAAKAAAKKEKKEDKQDITSDKDKKISDNLKKADKLREEVSP